jgi:hypothetical protein
MAMGMGSSRRLVAVTVALAVYAATLLAPSAQAAMHGAASPTPYQTAAQTINALAAQVVASYQQKSSPTDTRYYSNGLWVSDDMGCWPCNIGPAVADAILARGDSARIPVVVASFNRALRDHQAADGSFVGGFDSPGIQTAEFVPELGVALIALGSQLDAATRAAWTSAITRGADYLIASGDTTWYANGNVNLQYAEVLYLAWRFSGQQRYADAYQAEWNFVTNPPAPRWSGYGLVLTKTPNKPDGSDGAGYLTEQGSGAPGFDPEYTELQLDTAAALYVFSHDARALRLMNLLLNQEWPRIGPTFTLDATGGSRHSLYTAFMSSGLALLVRYGRSDLAARLPAQTARIVSEYQTYMVYTHRNYYFGLSRWLMPVLLDSVGVPPLAAPASAGVPSVAAPAASTGLGGTASQTPVPAASAGQAPAPASLTIGASHGTAHRRRDASRGRRHHRRHRHRGGRRRG